MRKTITLSRHIMEHTKEYPEGTGMLSGLLNRILFVSKIIAREVNKAGLVDILGYTGKINIQGEEVQKLDEFANDTFIKVLDHTGFLCLMASEENKDVIHIPKYHPQGGRFVLNFDPLDGSSNIDANISVGSIFSIHQRKSQNGPTIEDCLQKGNKQIGAGYIIYGSSTMFVYSVGKGVHGFTLDPSIGDFILSHENIKIPARGNIYSINEGNYNRWDKHIRQYIDYLKKEDPETNKRPYTSRYIGSFVADFHRNLLYGGIFLYPADKKNPQGKLRLLFEAAPMAFLVEQAGGIASTGKERILDIQPTSLHQRVPLIIGSREDVLEAEKFIQEKI
jgi:fructose-1,6-bisphosphatase I